jgi:hypothetical protein
VAPGAANLGGIVVLADTNMTYEHERTDQMRGEHSGPLRFRNSKSMHLEEVKEEDSLVAKAKSGVISILSVKIGG